MKWDQLSLNDRKSRPVLKSKKISNNHMEIYG